MHVCIIGAGPVGLLQSLFLAEMHHQLGGNELKISIFERRSQQDLVEGAAGGGKSINLALSWRGMRALERVGLLKEVLETAVPMKGRFIHPLHGSGCMQPYSSNPDQVIYSIGRSKIQKILLKAVLDHCILGNDVAQIKINFRQQLIHLDPHEMILDFSTIKTVRADLVLGCDGAFSRVRTEMMKHFPGKVIQETFQHQYREFNVPANASLKPAQCLHIWPRRNLMLIALPNFDQSCTATLFCDFAAIENDPVNFFKENFPDFLDAIGRERLLRDWRDNPVNKLITVQVDPIGKGKIVLLGDAAHSILPFYGQGMNAGFEDVQLFTDCLIKSHQTAIEQFSKFRIADAKAIDLLARENYKEMRAKVLNPFFVYRSRALQLLNIFFPTTIIPRYSMISFTSIPYSFIKNREIIQDLCIVFIIAIVVAIILSANSI